MYHEHNHAFHSEVKSSIMKSFLLELQKQIVKMIILNLTWIFCFYSTSQQIACKLPWTCDQTGNSSWRSEIDNIITACSYWWTIQLIYFYKSPYVSAKLLIFKGYHSVNAIKSNLQGCHMIKIWTKSSFFLSFFLGIIMPKIYH